MLGVLCQPMRSFDDGDPGAALDGHEREIGGQRSDRADADLPAGPVGRAAMDVGMVTGRHHPAAATRPARPILEHRRGAQQGGRKVECQGRLARSSRADEQHGMGRRAGRDQRMTALAEVCPRVRSAVIGPAQASAALRVEVRRFGLSSVAVSADSADAAAPVEALRVEVRRFGLSLGRGLGRLARRG